jgi:Ni,Fe-hydrogenase III large subunit
VARATGLGVDARRGHPAASYDEAPPAVATRDGGDVLARLHVMLAEAAESARLIGQFLDAGTGADTGAAAGTAALPAQGGTGLGWAESSRGESLAWVAQNDAGRITRARRPAAVRNWRGFDDACRSRNVFTDIPIIEASLWLTVACSPLPGPVSRRAWCRCTCGCRKRTRSRPPTVRRCCPR